MAGGEPLKEAAAGIRRGTPTEKSRRHRHACYRLEDWTAQIAAVLDDGSSESEQENEEDDPAP